MEVAVLSKEELEVTEAEAKEVKAEEAEVPKKAEKDIKFSYFEPVAGIIFAIVASVIFLVFPHIIAVVFVSGPLIPTFDAEVIRSFWIPIVLWAILRIFVEVFYLVERRYTKRLAIGTMIGNGLAFICTLIIFIPYRIVNVDYIDWIHTYFASIAAEWFGEILARPNIVIIVIMLIGLILDSITVVRKGFKKKKEEDEEEEDEVISENANIDDEAEKAEEIRVEAD